MIKKRGKKEIHYAYLIELISDITHKRKYVKVGLTNDLNRRMDELEDKYECTANILEFFWFNSREPAEMTESMMRKHFKDAKGSHYIRQDRFQRTYPTQADYDYIWQEAQHLAKRYDN